MPLLDRTLRDTRYAVRVLGKTPVFTLTAILTLGLAIAINTAVFSVVDAVLLQPLPYPVPDRLALVASSIRAAGALREETAQHGVTWQTIRDRATTFDRAVFSGWTMGVNLIAGNRASYVEQQRVGAGFFGVLGIQPLIGREFSAGEDRAGGPAATILSFDLWRSMFGADPSVVGRAIVVGGDTSTVVGVMPDGFQTGERADLWTPLRASTTGAGENENYAILARVREQSSWSQAEAELQQIGAEILRQRPAPEGTSTAFSLQPLQRGLTANLRQPLLLLSAAVAIVLLVACVNLAGLLLARTSGRSRELATRMALGGGRSAVVRMLLTESVVLAVAGAVIGVALGHVALGGLETLAGKAFDIWQPVALDARAIGVALVLALVASALFGLVPALGATRINVQAAMIEAGARSVAGNAHRWPRRVLVVAQVALGVVLLVGAGLLMRTFAHLRNLSPGFDPAGVITATVSLEDSRYATAARVGRLFDQTVERVRQERGIESAAVALGLPYERLLNLGFRHLDGPEVSAPRGRMTSATYVTGDFFSALRIPVRAGRTFDARDRVDSPGVVVVNETLARQYFNGTEPVGRRIRFAGRDREIVGVVGDVPVRPGWGEHGPLAAMPLAYIPVAQTSDGFLRLVHGWFSPAFIVRTSAGPEAAIGAMRRAIDATDPLLPFARVRSMADVQAASLAEQRVLTVLFAALALATVLLAAIGLHGLIATSVVERTREMGIRMALGASVSQAMRTLALPGVVLALAGTAIGAVAARAGTGLLRHFVWGVNAADPLTFAGVAAIFLIVASVASVAPTLRILRLDPATTLRQD